MAKPAKITPSTASTERFEIAIIGAFFRANSASFAFLARLSQTIVLADLRTPAFLTDCSYSVVYAEVRAFTVPT